MTSKAIGSTVGALAVVGALSGSSLRPQTDDLRLVVVISVDQMRPDYLERFGEQFDGGFARLAAQGTFFTDAHHDHAITETAPGHATLATGVVPARSGIVSNDWWDRKHGRAVYAVEDRGSPILGDTIAPGRSPDNLERETVGDWLKRASKNSKVFSVATKDRAAVLMGGKRADGVYWYNPGTGRFVTSRHYQKNYPEWVEEFNDGKLVDSYFAQGWSKFAPEEAYHLSREDDFRPEADSVHTTFPHSFLGEGPGPDYYYDLQYTPFGDELALTFARDLVINEELGTDDVVDLLLFSASAADRVGHEFGPYSQEIQDYYLRLDRWLGEFFTFLDDRVGVGNYVVALSSDHGVSPVPEEMSRRGLDAKRITAEEWWLLLEGAFLQALMKMDPLSQPSVVSLFPGGLVIRFPESHVSDEQMRTLRSLIAEALKVSELVEDVFTHDELREGKDDRPYFEAYLRSFHRERTPDLIIRFKKNYLRRVEPRGTTHYTPYAYDTHVPMIFMGPGISSGRYSERVLSVDFAPTVATILGVRPPDDLDGRILEQAVPSRP
jgi:predicted AlkP superfamily pyrophosphatase or phosphodiesterase